MVHAEEVASGRRDLTKHFDDNSPKHGCYSAFRYHPLPIGALPHAMREADMFLRLLLCNRNPYIA